MPLQHFFSVVPRSRYNITHIGFGFNTFLEKSELALASVSTRFSAQRLFDPMKQSSLAVNSRDTKHGFCSVPGWLGLLWIAKGKLNACCFLVVFFDIPSPLLEF